MKTIVDFLNMQKENNGSKTAYIFLKDREGEEVSITYEELATKAKMLGERLGDMADRNDRILLLYPPGLEYIIAFYACLYKGLIAVPAYPPDHQNINRIYSIIKDSKAKVALCSKMIYEQANATDSFFKDVDTINKDMLWLSTDILNEPSVDLTIDTEIKEDDVAFLQYTSGSTSEPKGVMVTHANLVANCNLISTHFEYTDKSVKVSWLPPYHDLGLIGSIIHPMMVAMTSVLMAPTSFVFKPIRWLRTITKYSQYGCIATGGPNFAYEMCCNYISDRQLEGLDLSNWRIAYNGAEPIRVSTLKKFTEKFAKVGFKYQNFNPVYGLAEGTLMVTTSPLPNKPVIKKLDLELLKNNTVKEITDEETKHIEIVACGRNINSQKIVIVDVDTHKELPPNQIGKIWVKGPCITNGYWGKEQATIEAFNSFISGSNEGPYLCTGDLGFFDEEKNLFMTGRAKELIIIRGFNHYPQDIEQTVERACPSLRKGCGSAFSIEKNNEEVLVTVYEVKNKHKDTIDIEASKLSIKDAITKKHGIAAYDVVFIESSSFPKTSSGKLQRRLSKQQYLNNELQVIQPAELVTV